MPEAPAQAQDRRQLRILRQRVQQIWIDGYLRAILHDVPRIRPGRQVLEEAVDEPWGDTATRPWEMVLHRPGQARRTLPEQQSMLALFREVGEALLVLGPPGSGKTTALLDVAREALREADAHADRPVPVVFNLSTWAPPAPLLDWLVDELKAKYKVPEQHGRRWLGDYRLLLLLDGLDEVAEAHRAACVEQINVLIDSGVPGILVCSRLEEYNALPGQLKLNAAVGLVPLTPEQVDAYLEQAGEALASLRVTLHSDPPLRELSQSPLMLNVMSRAYHGLTAADLQHEALDTVEERRHHLLATYIDRMFERVGEARWRFGRTETLRWLGELARQMQQRSQTLFLIEQLQPSWLATRPEKLLYTLVSRILSGVLLGVVLGTTILLLLIRPHQTLLFRPSDAWPWFGLAMVFGMLAGGTAGLLDALRFAWGSRTAQAEAPRGANLIYVASYAVLMTVSAAGLVRWIGGEGTLWFGVLGGLVWGLVVGWFLSAKRPQYRLEQDIRTVEALGWSGARAWRQGQRGAIAGWVSGLGLGLVGLPFLDTGDVVTEIIVVLLIGLGVGLLGGAIGGVFGGLQGTLVEDKRTPNEGIRLSLRNTAVGGGIVGGVFGLLIAGPVAVVSGLERGLLAGLAGGFFAGALAALWYGGFDVILHYTLRGLLVARGYLPRRLVAFLNYAADLVLLRRAGGTYAFLHRVLLEHVAQTEAPASETPTATPDPVLQDA